jgi:hypothetical protein
MSRRAVTAERRDLAAALAGGFVDEAFTGQFTSNKAAAPMPPPTHMVATM